MNESSITEWDFPKSSRHYNVKIALPLPSLSLFTFIILFLVSSRHKQVKEERCQYTDAGTKQRTS